ncbi:MAG: hypothetical protein GY814_07820 [Gammaproteobacteria bacterium]|nr:hypothetical protein [Gammaproteobacteria bacterium]
MHKEDENSCCLDNDNDDYDEDGCCLGEDDDEGDFEDLLNERLQQARVLIDKEETVESRELLRNVLDHGDYQQGETAAAMILEVDAIIAAAEEAAAEEELAASADQGDDEGETA